MSDEELDLVRRAQRGDIGAFEALVEVHQHKLFRFILAIAGNAEDAEDSLQETLLRAYRALPTFRGNSSLSTWLYRIALNTTRNWIRRQTRASSERIAQRMLEMAPETPRPLDEGLVANDTRDAVRRAVRKLPDHYREAILLRHYHSLTYEEIADILQVPIGTVRSRIAQGRHLLLKQLDAQGYTVIPEEAR